MDRIEAFDEIQVFVKGTGMCLWGRILPNTDESGYKLALTVWPLRETVDVLRTHGVEFRYGMNVMPLLDANGTIAHVPSDVVDVVFGDNRRISI